jgi:hypothetical protein
LHHRPVRRIIKIVNVTCLLENTALATLDNRRYGAEGKI